MTEAYNDALSEQLHKNVWDALKREAKNMDRDFGPETKRAGSRQVEEVETQCTRLARLLACLLTRRE